jgi:hypothetical protein
MLPMLDGNRRHRLQQAYSLQLTLRTLGMALDRAVFHLPLALLQLVGVVLLAQAPSMHAYYLPCGGSTIAWL